ncbi:GntR family transcriptional regulator [Lysinibacillus contaminans]|uniref:GntR family transcriptional regulator n=1 Tax=Lysinibacillus contaminans TaxID=1293441 RepID=A0ABR5JXN4_9BACI|nr:GntR family transcriptional regulator [Lysinibacillus contaminans]KOS66799.1 GntR family transcriptional regulator [Lysinibacillus contaminans]
MNLEINNLSKTPKYSQIANQIIKEKLLEPYLLPSIRSLAKELEISVITIKRAYEVLETEGFIITVGGNGSYVASINYEFSREAKVKVIEEKITETVTLAKLIGLTFEELQEIIKPIYKVV